MSMKQGFYAFALVIGLPRRTAGRVRMVSNAKRCLQCLSPKWNSPTIFLLGTA